MEQMDLFSMGRERYRIDKPLRLIELFAGYGSQRLAWRYLDDMGLMPVPYESWKIAEWAIPSIQAYKDLHCGDDITDYSLGKSRDEIEAYLAAAGISSDYNNALTLEQIHRKGEKKVRQIYNNIRATKNLCSVTNISAADLEITDRDKYCYMLTYSFPCQDLSVANFTGKGLDGARSGLLREVQRILKECEEANCLPQVLLMENVPALLFKKNRARVLSPYGRKG